MIVAASVALKQALGFESTSRAAVACIIGWVISTIFQGLLYFLLLSAFGISSTPF